MKTSEVKGRLRAHQRGGTEGGIASFLSPPTESPKPALTAAAFAALLADLRPEPSPPLLIVARPVVDYVRHFTWLRTWRGGKRLVANRRRRP